MITLDKWQQEVLDCKGNICLRSGRQVGKSFIISRKAGDFALKHPNKFILIIASVERQSELIFEKVLTYVHDTSRISIKMGKDRPTKHKLQLKNGSTILCVPTGESGYGIRGFTIDMLIADEAAFIPEAVWTAVTPMLAVTQGFIILLSTPFGREGYFARCFTDPAYTKFHISSEDCPRIDKSFLAHEKATMTRLQYQQEYQGLFVDDLMQFFPDDLIIKCQVLKRVEHITPRYDYFLGVDVGGRGGDETTLEIIDRTDRKLLRHVENIIAINNMTTQTEREILHQDNLYHFKKIYIDSSGIGVGVFDHLLELDQTKRRVVSIENARRALDRDETRLKKLLKEDLYNNLLCLMERGEIQLLDDPEVFQSLKSVQFEYADDKTLKIFGRYTHIAEGLIRAAFCSKDKSLNPFIA